jgi:hypothetical protein
MPDKLVNVTASVPSDMLLPVRQFFEAVMPMAGVEIINTFATNDVSINIEVSVYNKRSGRRALIAVQKAINRQEIMSAYDGERTRRLLESVTRDIALDLGMCLLKGG